MVLKLGNSVCAIVFNEIRQPMNKRTAFCECIKAEGAGQQIEKDRRRIWNNGAAINNNTFCVAPNATPIYREAFYDASQMIALDCRY